MLTINRTNTNNVSLAVTFVTQFTWLTYAIYHVQLGIMLVSERKKLQSWKTLSKPILFYTEQHIGKIQMSIKLRSHRHECILLFCTWRDLTRYLRNISFHSTSTLVSALLPALWNDSMPCSNTADTADRQCASWFATDHRHWELLWQDPICVDLAGTTLTCLGAIWHRSCAMR